MISLVYAIPIFCNEKKASIDTKKTEEQIKKPFEQTAYKWSRTYAQVLELMDRKHYNIADLEQNMINSLQGLVSMDPHSSFLDPKTYRSMMESTSGEFFGVGIVIDNTRKTKDKFLIVIDTIPDGPADKAGIQPLDKILEVDGVSLEGMPTEKVITKLKGKRHTPVEIKVLRENQKDLLSFNVKRDLVKEQNSLGFLIKDHNIYYLSLNSFSANAMKQIEKLLRESQKNKYKGIILDLRNNSGGLLTAAIDIAGLFVDKGSLVVTTKDKTGTVTETYKTLRKPLTNSSVPIFILINNFTASAAEILAGALKIHSQQMAKKKNNHQLMTFLVGTKTHGKGSVQEVIPIGNDCAVKLTTALYFLPNDTTVQGIGIQPDFMIERTLPQTEQMKWFTKTYGREESLSNHIKPHGKPFDKLRGGRVNQEKKLENKPVKKTTKKGSGWLERAQKMLETDNQLRETISLVNLFHTFQTVCPDKVCNRNKAIDFLKQNHITNETIEIQEV